MRTVKTLLFSLLLLSFAMQAGAKDYNASLFGIRSNGTTLNTTSIQRAIDYIHENGGGRLVFYVGRYLTGTVELKSNVTIHLNEGAVLVGSTNPYDYDTVHNRGWQALIKSVNANNIAITGKGVIDGQGREMSYNLIDLIQKGLIKDGLGYDRPAIRPTLVYFRECQNVEVDGIMLKNSAFWVQIYDQCKDMVVNNITVDSKAYWNNDGIDIVDCVNFKLTNSFIDATDDAICLKSHDPNVMCQNIEIRNNTARSSASAIKFGTASRGGFKDIILVNNTVYDTYRSAFTIESVDGSLVDNILVDSLYSYNTGNVIFLRIGDRNVYGKTSNMTNVTIQNVYAEVPFEKPDAGYEYEGPIEDMPRNISPCVIAGVTTDDGRVLDIDGVTLRNIEIVYPGGGNANFAYRGLKPADLDGIPQMPAAYPEFSQWKELPAWGFWVRHAKNVTFDNVTLTAEKRDYRPAIVLQDVENVTLEGMKYNEPGGGKKQVHSYKAKNVVTKK